MRTRLALATALCVLAVGSLQAQGGVRLGLGGGIVIPLRDYSDAVEKGWLGQANLTFFPISSTSIGFRLDGFYGRSGLSGADGRQSHAGGLASVVFQFGSKRLPNRFYVFGGGGYVRTGTDSPSFGKVSATNPAISAGGGVSFGGQGLAFFAEGRYINVYSDRAKPQFAPLVVGISLGGL